MYIVSEMKRTYDFDRYKLYETMTDSYMRIAKDGLVKLIKSNKVDIKNASLNESTIVIKDWPNKIYSEIFETITEGGYILLCGIGEKFKLIGNDERIIYVDKEQLIRYVLANKIANCAIENEKLKVVDNYSVIKNSQFEAEIAQKYDRYTAISATLGMQTRFKYTIEGTEVKLIKYTGKSKSVIVPKFITSIMAKAFSDCKVEEVTLEPGLKAIGSRAFSSCRLSEVIIPETVQFIGDKVFLNNERLDKYKNGRSHKVKILNRRALVMDKYAKHMQ